MAEPSGRPEVQAAVALSQVQDVREDLREIKDALSRIDDRLRRLEEWRSWVLGAAAAVGAAAGFISKWVADKVVGR